MRVLEYIDTAGVSPFRRWFDDLDERAAAKVSTALTRVANGNLSNVKSIGSGVFEYRIDSGPGYRIYFGFDGEEIVILVGGGTKQRQQREIADARARWQDYKARSRSA
jgi:putative addiction module killer protein